MPIPFSIDPAPSAARLAQTAAPARVLGWIAAGLLWALGSARAEIWSLADAQVEVKLDDRAGTFAVTEKSSGRIWRELPAGNAYSVAKVERRGGTLVMQLNGEPRLRATLALAPNSDLEVSVSADPAAKMTALRYPGPLATPAGDWNLVCTDSEGYLLPVREAGSALHLDQPFPIYSMSGLIMPWIGLTDPSLRAGYMMIVDTPFDAAISLTGRTALPAPEPVWSAEFGRFGYERRLRYHFFATGGYVAQAKHYRDRVRSTGQFSTLRDRARARPQIDRLIGAVQIYTWADGRKLEFARELKRSGIDRAWIGWDPSHLPYPAPGIDEGLKQMGYLSGVYDLYRDLYDDRLWNAQAATHPLFKQLWLDRYVYPGLFEKIVARNADGTPRKVAFSPEVGLTRYWVSTAAIQPYVPDRITRELRTYPHDSVFLDVTLAAELFESRDPARPMTRREDAANRLAIHRYMADKLHLVVGSEWGADYGVPVTEFMHGAMSLNKFWGQGVRDPASPYYLGDFANNERPSMVLGDSRASPAYRKYGLGEAYRIPLYELVYHDCTVSSWRWDDDSFKEPEAWARKDLFNALYATAPLWNLDRITWNEHRERLVSGYRAISPVLRAVGYDEMLDHRFLTADRKVQETVFASGKRVIANFGDLPCVIDATTIPAGGFALTGR